METILFQQTAQQAHDEAVRLHQDFVNEQNNVYFRNQETEVKVAGENRKPADWDEVNAYIERVAAEIKAAISEME